MPETTSPLRILQVLASLDRGGAEAMIMALYRAIDKTKIQFDFVVNARQKEYSFEPEIKTLGGRIFRVPQYTITNHSDYRKAWKILLKAHPEWIIIHGHHTSPAFIYIPVAKSLNRITIVHSHTSGGEFTLKSQLKRLSRYTLKFQSDHLFACSEAAAKWMFRDKHKNTKVLNNAIDSQAFIFSPALSKKKRNEFKLNEEQFVLGHIGRFDKAKNQSFLIDIFHSLQTKHKNAVLLLIGDGPLRSAMEEKATKLGLSEQVIFTGIRSDIPELLQAMDVFVFPSLYEGLPVTVIEAQAAGLKCILSDSITDEVKITNLVEFISLEKSPEFWAEKVLQYANGYERKDTSQQIKKAGYDVQENACWLENFYLNAIQTGKGN